MTDAPDELTFAHYNVLDLLDDPGKRCSKRKIAELRALGFVDDDNRVTPTGRAWLERNRAEQERLRAEARAKSRRDLEAEDARRREATGVKL